MSQDLFQIYSIRICEPGYGRIIHNFVSCRVLLHHFGVILPDFHPVVFVLRQYNGDKHYRVFLH